MVATYQFLNDVLDGPQEVHLASGALLQTTHFQKGILHGPLKLYNGPVLIAENHYQNGQLHGKGRYFNEEGKQLGVVCYRRGKPHGLHEWKTSEGHILSRQYYKNGELQDPQQEGNIKGDSSKENHEKAGDSEEKPSPLNHAQETPINALKTGFFMMINALGKWAQSLLPMKTG